MLIFTMLIKLASSCDKNSEHCCKTSALLLKYLHYHERYSAINNWISHWCKVLSFNLTTLMQDTLDITGAD